MNLTLVIIFLVVGVLAILAAIFNWDWFYTRSRVEIFIKMFGRDGSRIFYAVFGLILIAVAVLNLMGVIVF